MNRLLTHLGPPLRALRAVLGNRAMTRLQVAFLLFNVGEAAMWVAILVFAYDEGGTGAVGLVSILLMIPSGLVAPIAAALGDRIRRDRVLRWGYAAQGVGAAVVAVAMIADLALGAVLTLATLAALAFTTGRPNHHALLPSLAEVPQEVAAGNSVSSLGEGLGATFGGLLAGLVLALAGPGAVYCLTAVAACLAAALTFGIRGPDHAGEEAMRPWTLARDAAQGLATLARARDPRLLVLLAAALTLASGVVGVLTVPLVIDVLGLGEPGVGLLNTAWSVGSFVGAAASVGFVTRRRLAWPIVAGAGAFAVGSLVFGLAQAAVVVVVASVLAGSAIALLDVLGRTLLQRVTDDAVLTRVFGAVESLWFLGYGAGSAIAPFLERAVGLDAAFVLGGGLMLACAALAIPGLRRIDRAAVVPDRQVALLGAIGMFAPLPRVDLERLAAMLDRIDVVAGTELIRQGDIGDRFYVVDAGTFEIVRDGVRVALAPVGDHFGEIALLHDVPRTATVRALEDGAVWALDQEEFLATVTGLPQAERAAQSVSAERLRTTPGAIP
ncbi:MAG TPA: cyclic nucleotide-binding domain-containing protein [Actinomycetota bacterium]